METLACLERREQAADLRVFRGLSSLFVHTSPTDYFHQNPLKARLVSDIAANEELFQSNIVGEPSLADEEYYTYIDAGSFEQFPDY